jgi:poly(A) polymerase
VRFVGDPRQRIAEDRLRLLRFFRFMASYGRDGADPDGLAAAIAAAPELAQLSGERIQAEMLKLLSARDPVRVMALMAEGGVLGHAMPSRFDLRRMAAVIEAEAIAGLSSDPIRRLGALIDEGEAGVRAVAARWRLANADRARLLAMIASAPPVSPDLPPKALRRALYGIGPARWQDRVLAAWAEALAEGRGGAPKGWIGLLKFPERWTPPALPVKGRDLVKLGLSPGPEIGDLMEKLEAWWIEEDFAPDRRACLDWAARRTGRPKG